jgi:glycosyltransferase involved in cell wall biosynthesis
LRRDGRITAVVFSRNEADLLRGCLARLSDFEEVLVCDMESTDATRETAEDYGARVLPVPFTPVVEGARQCALDAVTSEWTFFVDADELVPHGFRDSLPLDALPGDVAGVRLRYTNVALGVPLQHLLQGSAKYSLLRSDLVQYETPVPHVPPTFLGPVVDASRSVPPILHEGFRSIEQTFEKMLRYAKSDSFPASAFADPLHLPKEITRDILADAWRDGRTGVMLVTLNAIARFYAAALTWEQQGFPDRGLTKRQKRLLNAAEISLRCRLRRARCLNRRQKGGPR